MLNNEDNLSNLDEDAISNESTGSDQAAGETEDANKPQPNVILNKVGGGTNATSYRDTERVSPRANEASDQNDTNTGGIVAGGAKGASQS